MGRFVMGWPEKMWWPPVMKATVVFYFYALLFVGCYIVIHTPSISEAPSYKKSPLPHPSKPTTTTSTTAMEPELISTPNQNTNQTQTSPSTTTPPPRPPSPPDACPHYFRWIHEDLRPWKTTGGISRDIVEAAKPLAFFRLIVVDGKVYVQKYKKAYQTRDEFTIWGILQLLRLYPGKLPDLDLMFECDDRPVIQKGRFGGEWRNGTREESAGEVGTPPPMFHYCGDGWSYDIVFPDWSFWGWAEINIKPWESLKKEIKQGNQRVKWRDRTPFAFWKGNLHMGNRRFLLPCNSTRNSNTLIYSQRWALEAKHGFRTSNLAEQCTHRYKIYMEGKAWSVSEKYVQACDSMLLLVRPLYYEFFARSLVPLKHFWPINPNKFKLCNSLKFAVQWGNHFPLKAQEIGEAGSKFIMEELKMKYIYDYMFHLLNEYAKLLTYKPEVPPGAVEVPLETMIDTALGREKAFKIESMVKEPSSTSPCDMPPPFDPKSLSDFVAMKEDVIRHVMRWEASRNIEQVHLQ